MVKTGIWMNVISILLLTVFVYVVLGALWDVDLDVFPVEMK